MATNVSNSDDKKEQVKEYFSRTADNYVNSMSHSKGSDLVRIIEIGEWDDSLQALDIATGGGHTALTVAPHVAQITVTDLTPNMLEKAKDFLISQGVTNGKYQIADAEQLPFPDSSFDRVTCRIAPHHFSNVAQAVNEIARVLKPNGLFLLIDSCASNNPELDAFVNEIEKRRDHSHVRSYTQEEWESFFQKANLEIEVAESFIRTHNYADWTNRSQLFESETLNLEKYILSQPSDIKDHYGVITDDQEKLISFTTDFILLKARKK